MKQFNFTGKRVLVTGSYGFVGSNIVPILENKGCVLFKPTRNDYNLLEQNQVRSMINEIRPELVFHLAALSGGIGANRKYPASFFYQNLMMNTILMHECSQSNVTKYITLIGGCSYPANAPNPIKEEDMWIGYPQAESAPYSVAKKMNITMSDAYRKQYGLNSIVLVPGNLYGPHDNFDLENSHVVPALIRKYYEAVRDEKNKISAWGTGKPVRDFIYIEDACEAIVLASEIYNSSEIINISTGQEISIKELVEMIAELSGYNGEIEWDISKPDGQMFKGFDNQRMKKYLNYIPRHSLKEGLSKTINWFKENYENARLEVPV